MRIKHFFSVIYQIIFLIKKALIHIYTTICPGHKMVILLYFILFYQAWPVLFDKFTIEYQTYKNIDVIDQDYRMNGRLNKYKTIQQINNKCYYKHCGLLENGEYKLSEIKFVTIQGKEEIFSFCTNQHCFLNIDIERKKVNLRYEAKLAAWVALCLIIISYIESLVVIRNERRKKSVSNIHL